MTGLCQEWQLKPSSNVYAMDGQEQLTLTWIADFKSKRMVFASWSLLKEDGTEVALVAFDQRIENIVVFSKTKIKNDLQFGEITLLKLDKDVDKIIVAKIEFTNGPDLVDEVKIVYVGKCQLKLFLINLFTNMNLKIPE